MFWFQEQMCKKKKKRERLTWIVQPFTISCDGKAIDFVASCRFFLPLYFLSYTRTFSENQTHLLSCCRSIQFTSQCCLVKAGSSTTSSKEKCQVYALHRPPTLPILPAILVLFDPTLQLIAVLEIEQPVTVEEQWSPNLEGPEQVSHSVCVCFLDCEKGTATDVVRIR